MTQTQVEFRDLLHGLCTKINNIRGLLPDIAKRSDGATTTFFGSICRGKAGAFQAVDKRSDSPYTHDTSSHGMFLWLWLQN